MTGIAWRLTYTDSGGNQQVIAELAQDTGEFKIDHIQYTLKPKDPWFMTIYADPSIIDQFPNEVSDFQSSEPEILFEEYDGSTWTTRGRFYAKSGGTNEDNEFAVTLYDFYHKLMNQEVSVSNTTTHIVDVLKKALPSGYVVDAPSSGSVSGGYPSVDGYSANNTQRRKVFREITRDNNWSLFFLPEQDGSGDWKVRFEPDGFGGTVDTLDSSTDQFKFKSWEPVKKTNLITKTFVSGVDSSGSKITATAENTTIRDKYLGTNSGDHNYQKFKVGYLESQSEADTIAENRLVPGPSETEIPPKGRLLTTVYPQDVVNDSFALIDSFRGIDDTFRCVKQQNFFPSNQSYISLSFEQEGLEKRAEGEENLRDERGRLYPSSSTDVGPLGLNVGDASAQTTSTSQSGTADADTTSSSESGTADADTTSSSSLDSFTLGFGSSQGFDSNSSLSLSGSLSYTYSGAAEEFRIYVVKAQAASNDGRVRINIQQGGVTIYDTVQYILDTVDTIIRVPLLPDLSLNSDVNVFFESLSSVNELDCESEVITEAPTATISTTTTDNGHGAPTDNSEHQIQTSTTDNGHGAPTDNSEHQIQTSTNDSGHGSDQTDPHGGDTDQGSVNATQEDKTDR